MASNYFPMNNHSRLRWLTGVAAISAAACGLGAMAAGRGGEWGVAIFGSDPSRPAPLIVILSVLLGLAGVTAWQQRQTAILRQALVTEKRRHSTPIEHLALFTQQANDVILILDETMRIIEANERVVAFYGRTPAEMRQLTVKELRSVEAAGTLPADYAAALRPDGIVIETMHRRKNGTVFPVEVSARPVEVEGRRYVFAIVRDSTACKQTERVVAHNEARLRRAEQVAGIGNWAINVVTKEVTASPNARRIYGLVEGKLTLAEIQSVPLPEYRARLDAALHDLVAEGRPYELEFQIRRATDGQIMAIHSIAEFDPATHTVFGVIHDFTGRKQSEAALRESEAQTRALISAIPDLIFTNRRDGEFLAVHASDPKALFVPPDHFLHRRLETVLPQSVAEQFLKAFAAALDSDAMQELNYALTVGGEDRYFEARVVPSTKDTVISIIQDITARKRAELRLQLQSGALEAAANAMVITNREGAIEWANPAFTAISGYSLAEAIGQSPGRLLKSGKHEPAFYRGMWETIAAGNVWHGEVINRRKDGGLFPEEMTITPMRSGTGEITHFIAVKQDITQRKSLEAQLFQAQKMEAVGLLAGGVAHDFNNVLAVVLMYVGLLQDEPTLGRDIRSSLIQLEKEVRRGASLTRQLLTFSRQQAMEPTRLNLNSVVAGLIKMLHRLLSEQITITHERPAAVMLTEADEGMLEQVVMNLCINARDAMPRGGELKLAVDAVAFTADSPRYHAEVRPGRFLRLAISDTGSGMDTMTLQRIFEPFFTTKEVGKGTGLGLAIVHGIIKQHRGWIDVESVLGQGTTFRVFLPESETTGLNVATAHPLPQIARGRGETILVTEDEEGLRAALALVLRQHGYTVIEAGNGPQAIDRWKAHGGRVDLLITDMIMPGGMDGQDLVEQCQKMNPGLNVIVCTGYKNADGAEPFAVNPRITLLRKPFEMALLLATVRRSIDKFQVSISA